MPGEETLTDINLLEIQTRHPRRVKVRKLKYREASQSGTDLEWWIGDHRQWVGMRVQAKSVRPTTTPAQLARRLRYRGGQQLALPLASNARDGLFPLSCFYNATKPWLPGMYTTCLLFPQRSGCSITPAVWIRSALVARTQAQVLRDCRPWSCLVCEDCFRSSAKSLLEQVHDFLWPVSEGLQFEVSPLRERPLELVQAPRERVHPDRAPDRARVLLIEGEDGA
jgi:hypothetical protein